MNLRSHTRSYFPPLVQRILQIVTRIKFPHIYKHRVVVTRTETETGVLTSTLLLLLVHTKNPDYLKRARPQQPPATLFPACKRKLVVALRPVT